MKIYPNIKIKIGTKLKYHQNNIIQTIINESPQWYISTHVFHKVVYKTLIYKESIMKDIRAGIYTIIK